MKRSWESAFLWAHLAATLFLILINLTFPVYVPFVDDWLLINWATGEAPLNASGSFELVNGHQIFIPKLILALISANLSLSLPVMSIIFILIGSLAFYLISLPLIDSVQKKDKYFLLIPFLFLNLRQLQNYSMLICFQWMVSILAIAVFYYSYLQIGKKKLARYFLGLSLVAAPFTSGFGLVVSVCLFLYIVFDAITGNRRLNDFEVFIFTTLNVLSLYSAYIWPPNSGSESSAGSSFYPSDLLKILGFVPALTGQMFLPNVEVFQFRIFLLSASVLGIFLLLLAFKQIREYFYHTDLTQNLQPVVYLSILGLSAIALISVSRGLNTDISSSLEPRYSTGVILFVVPAIITLLNSKVRISLLRVPLHTILILSLFTSSILVGTYDRHSRLELQSKFSSCNGKEIYKLKEVLSAKEICKNLLAEPKLRHLAE